MSLCIMCQYASCRRCARNATKHLPGARADLSGFWSIRASVIWTDGISVSCSYCLKLTFTLLLKTLRRHPRNFHCVFTFSLLPHPFPHLSLLLSSNLWIKFPNSLMLQLKNQGMFSWRESSGGVIHPSTSGNTQLGSTGRARNKQHREPAVCVCVFIKNLPGTGLN